MPQLNSMANIVLCVLAAMLKTFCVSLLSCTLPTDISFLPTILSPIPYGKKPCPKHWSFCHSLPPISQNLEGTEGMWVVLDWFLPVLYIQTGTDPILLLPFPSSLSLSLTAVSSYQCKTVVRLAPNGTHA